MIDYRLKVLDECVVQKGGLEKVYQILAEQKDSKEYKGVKRLVEWTYEQGIARMSRERFLNLCTMLNIPEEQFVQYDNKIEAFVEYMKDFFKNSEVTINKISKKANVQRSSLINVLEGKMWPMRDDLVGLANACKNGPEGRAEMLKELEDIVGGYVEFEPKDRADYDRELKDYRLKMLDIFPKRSITLYGTVHGFTVWISKVKDAKKKEEAKAELSRLRRFIKIFKEKMQKKKVTVEKVAEKLNMTTFKAESLLEGELIPQLYQIEILSDWMRWKPETLLDGFGYYNPAEQILETPKAKIKKLKKPVTIKKIVAANEAIETVKEKPYIPKAALQLPLEDLFVKAEDIPIPEKYQELVAKAFNDGVIKGKDEAYPRIGLLILTLRSVVDEVRQLKQEILEAVSANSQRTSSLTTGNLNLMDESLVEKAFDFYDQMSKEYLQR